MITFTPDSRAAVEPLKKAYLSELTAPMDGMWDVGFTNSAPHWAIRSDDRLAGYFVINDANLLLQFYVSPNFVGEAKAIFDKVLKLEGVVGAIVSTIDPHCISLCLDVQKKLVVHTFLYEYPVLDGNSSWEGSHPSERSFRLAADSDLDRVVALQQKCLSGGNDLGDWLRSYSANLIDRGELFVLCEGSNWLGLGECRKSDTQPGVADLGMMVDPTHRARGFAVEILSRLVRHAQLNELRPICSTTVENVGARKAIARAGFVSRHRILQVTF